MSRIIVTAAPPTPNGDLHLGHLSGPYLGADVLTRVRRQLGDEVLHVSYSDDYQSYVQRKALQTGVSSQELALRYGATIEATLIKAHIVYDYFMHTLKDSVFLESLHAFYFAAENAGVLSKRPASVPYSAACRVWGYEAFARGICPRCGASADTSQCESCAFPPAIEQMKDIRCILDGVGMEMVKVEQLFLDLEAHRRLLEKLYAELPVRPQLRTFFDAVLAAPLEPWAISRPHDWGPLVPNDPNASLHTWFAGIAGYHAASREWAVRIGHPDRWRDFWEDSGTSIVHFIGFDCSFSHAVVYPSLLSHMPHTPRLGNIITNMFLNLQGHGFSTSRGLAIWASEFLDDVEADALRYYLALNAPDVAETNFVLADFQAIVNDDLVRTLSIALEQVPSDRPPAYAELSSRLEPIRLLFARAASIDGFSLNGLATSLRDIIALMRTSKPADMRPLLSAYSLLGRSLQPTFSEALRGYLGLSVGWGVEWLTQGGELPPVPEVVPRGLRPVFRTVEDAIIQKFQVAADRAIQKNA